MASPSELSLECKPNSNSMLLKSFGDHQMSSAGFDQTHQSKLEEFLARLEEERLKIDAFKRELPLCMQLLTNALEASRQQLQAYRSKQGTGAGARPVLEEFIPLKTPNSSDNNISDNTGSDKANWMTTAQLWSQTEIKPQPSPASPPKEAELGFGVVSSQLTLDTKQRNGGAFLPFSKDRAAPALPELALASAAKDMDDNKCQPEASATQAGAKASGSSMDHNANNNAGLSNNNSSNCNANNTNGSANQPHRKARRCWSPDLHRRFVNALQMLGGSQVGTPKQIRELMKVDGLTNDEVKSHLQKYRLHTRRPSPTPQAAGAPAPQLVVLSGIWVPPEYATAGHTAASPALYGAHHAAAAHAQPHFCASPVPQDFYSAAAVVAASPATQAGPPPNQLHHHAIHHQLHMLKAQTQFHSSPESNVRGAGDQSESIEDGKSESSSWKGDSGDNGGDGERKGLAALREEGEESNGSDITLKF